jgi:hypothetical protein
MVLSIRLNEDWALFARTKLLAIARPPKKLGEHWTAGARQRKYGVGFRRVSVAGLARCSASRAYW